ncbi:MAG: HEAT repeat domain-containing protein [Planctomycetes bacterium]|nr:HEAT repeat domain-containing protein [Planctomycetota bacterium]MCB9909789.1 HEAT repeat domain-containing protein [Planctomycetota bacterium]MCB9912302.1 HEAT repeat domain-containing protein [Planctomycetota bacterium]HPF12741.1 HEAT repeat domain-containing protein [Planctomycetota bacterium]
MPSLQRPHGNALVRGGLTFALTLFTGSALAGWVLAPNLIANQNPSLESGQRAIHSILERAGDQAAAEISRLGGEAVEPLWDLVASGEWPQKSGKPDRPERVSEAHMASILGALSLLRDPYALDRAQRALASTEDGAGDRVTALHVLATIGKAEDMPLALALGSAPVGKLQRAIDFWFGKAVMGILVRDERGYASLAEAWEEAVSPTIEGTLLETLREVHTPESLELLMGRIQAAVDPNPAALTSLYRLAAELPVLPAGLSLTPIQRLLSHHAATIRAKAAMCLGSMDDFESVESLIGLLQDEAKEVREYANLALRRLSGRGFAIDPVRWTAWHRGEQTWWQADGRDALQELKSFDQGKTLAAAFQLSQHRIFASEFVPELVGRLQEGSPEFQVSVCQALGQTGHRAAVPGLLRQLSSSNDRVKAAALIALRGITGRRDSELWALADKP